MNLSPEDRALFDRFEEAGQGHVFRFFPGLPEAERVELRADLAAVDLELVTRLAREVGSGPEHLPPLAPLAPVRHDGDGRDEAAAAGRELLSAGRVAMYTVAGGQGTRLGFDGPKGCFPIGPASGKTLFRWHAEKVLAASRRYGRAIPWVILVSETNAETTRAYFARNAWFGLEGRVRFVRQRMLPAVDEEGLILLAKPHRIALSPNGHGGSVEAIAADGTLDSLAAQGVTVISYFQVDNALLNPADPVLLGHHALREAEMTAKVVRKLNPLEKAGVVTLVDGRPGVVEYSELPEAVARETDEHGELVHGLASIAAHTFSVGFLSRIRDAGLPYHCAVKDVPTVDEAGRPVKRTGRKFETFVFDAIPLARNFFAFLTEREEEFAPLKNAEGENSKEAVARALLDRAKGWYERAGSEAPDDPAELEMSPLRAYDFETFLEDLSGRRAE